MRKYNLILVIALVAVFSTSCRLHDGLTRNLNEHQTQVVLSEKNYKIVKYVEGDAIAKYYFGVGGGKSKRGLLARARENMLRNAGLVGSTRAIINESVETQFRQIVFMTEIRYIVSAYVVEFYNPETDNAPEAEPDVIVSENEIKTPNEVVSGVIAGVTLQTDKNDNDYTYTHTPGFHVGYSIEISNPDIKYLFWNPQINLSYLNEERSYRGNLEYKENTLALDVPFLVGVKIPITPNFQWFVKGGPFAGLIFSNSKKTPESSSYDGNRSMDFYPSLGGELNSGFQIGKNFQISAAHLWHIGYYEYDFSKISVGYYF